MADSMFSFLSTLDSRTVGEAAGVLRLPDEAVSPGMVSSIASPPGGLSEFFLEGTKSAVAAKGSRLAIPTSNTSCTLPTSVTIPGYGMELKLLALVHNPGATSEGFGEEYPVHNGRNGRPGGNWRAAMRVTVVTIRSHK
jgi:hypothetical protein